MKDSHIQFYALLLLSDMKWEVAYSTLCTDFFFCLFRNLYINLHMAGLHFIFFHKLDLTPLAHKHANTQAHVNQIWEESSWQQQYLTEWLDPLAVES